MNQHTCCVSWFCFGCFEFVCGCEVTYWEEHAGGCGGNCFPQEVAVTKIFRAFQRMKEIELLKTCGEKNEN